MKRQFILGLLFFSGFTVHATITPLIDAEDRRQVDAPAIASAAASKSASLRERAAIAYGRMQLPSVIEPLFKLLKD